MHRLATGGKSPTSTILHRYIWHKCGQYSVFNLNFINKSYMLVFFKLLLNLFLRCCGIQYSYTDYTNSLDDRICVRIV